jgi:hypothetical protein
MSPSDRVMHFTLDNGMTLAAVLYGPGQTSSSWRRGEEYMTRSRIRKNSVVRRSHFAAGGLTYDFDAFRMACASGGIADLSVPSSGRSFPAIGATLVLESITRAGADASVKTGGMDSARGPGNRIGDPVRAHRPCNPRAEGVSSPDGVSRVFFTRPAPSCRRPEGGDVPGCQQGNPFSLPAGGKAHTEDRERESVVAPLQQQLEKGRRAHRAIQADAREAERAGSYERFGSALMAGLPGLTKGMKDLMPSSTGSRFPFRSNPRSPRSRTPRGTSKKRNAQKRPAEEILAQAGELARRIERLEEAPCRSGAVAPGRQGGKIHPRACRAA